MRKWIDFFTIVLVFAAGLARGAAPLPFVELHEDARLSAQALRDSCEQQSWWVQLGDRLYSPTLAANDPPDPEAGHYFLLLGAPVPDALADRVAAHHLGKSILHLPGGSSGAPVVPDCPDCELIPLPLNAVLIARDAPGTPLATGIPDFEIERYLARVSVDRYLADVTTLSSIDSRCTNTDGNDQARDWIAAEFESLGLAVELQQYEPILRVVAYTNVIGRLEGSRYPDQFLVIGGHYDSIPCPPNLGPGAEDNASGTAGVLEAARILSQVRPAPQRTILFVAFSSEEQGLHGSRYFVKQLSSSERSNFGGALIMDMMAYTGDAIWDVNVESFASHIPFASTVIDAAEDFTPLTDYWVYNTARSDHMPFLEVGLPAVLIIETEASRQSWRPLCGWPTRTR